MATITVMKNYVMKKAQGSSDENLKKIGKVLKNYAKLSAEDKKKVGSAVEKLYTKFKAQETKSPAPKKSASAPKTSGSKKKIATQDLKSVIAKFKQKVGSKLWKQATSGTSSIKQDAERPALPKGKRISRTGRVYWENRSNRIDVKQKGYPRLAKGGQVNESPIYDNGVMISKPFFVEEISSFSGKKNEEFRINNKFDSSIYATFSVSDYGSKTKKDALKKANLFYDHCKGAKTLEQYEQLSGDFIFRWSDEKQDLIQQTALQKKVIDILSSDSTKSTQSIRQQLIDTVNKLFTKRYNKEIILEDFNDQSNYLLKRAKQDDKEKLKATFDKAKSLLESSNVEYAKGGKMKYADGDITDMGGLQFIEWKGEEIMFEPTYNEYFFNDRKYMSLESAKKAVEKAVSGGSADQSHLRGAYSRGMFAKGGEVGTIGKFKYEITMANKIEGPFVIAKFIAKGDALICLNALQKATSTKGMRYTLKEVK
jgi:hypothetical protein